MCAVYEHHMCMQSHIGSHCIAKKMAFKMFPKTSALGFKYWTQIPATLTKYGRLVW